MSFSFFFRRKLQVSARPDKIWFFNLQADPLEARNVAALLNITTIKDLKQLVDEKEKYADDENVLILIAVFELLEKTNSEQSAPLWPSLVECPVLIDKTMNTPESAGDEFIYWAN